MWKALKWMIVIVVATVAMLIAIGISDVLLSVTDDKVGILTSRAIRAVERQAEGQTTLGAVVGKARPTAVWSARHSDDDSLYSVEVTSLASGDSAFERLAPRFCVFFGLDWLPYPHVVVRDVAPGNRAAQEIAPMLGRNYGKLPKYGQFYCSGVKRYHQSAIR